MNKTMNADDRRFMDELEKRQAEAGMSDSLWHISPEDFDRAYALGKRNWAWVELNVHTFTQTDFYNFNFRHADLDGCKFQNANLRAASFSYGHLREVVFTHCNLSEVGWNSTDLRWLIVNNCNLEGVGLEQANLRCVTGIKTVSPVGHKGRTVLAYVYNGEIRIQAGCRNDVPKGMRDAIKRDYAVDLMAQEDYLDAVKLLERWGKREIQRLQS